MTTDPPATHTEKGRKARTWKSRARSVSLVITRALARRFPATFPIVFVVGYPKTGTTWASQLVADYLMLPFPRFPILPIGFEAVVHGHEQVHPRTARGVYVMRDGRDALVSQYFYVSRLVPDGDNPRIPRVYKGLFPGMRNKADTAANLPRFLESVLSHPVTSRPWHEHVRSFYDINNPGVVLLRYEDLLGNGPSALAAAMSRLTGEPPDPERAAMSLQRFAFDRLSRGRPGRQGGLFLRKGRAGDWRNHFTRECAEIFDRFAGDALVQSGYEPDRSWVGTVSDSPPAPAASPQRSP